MEIDDKLKLSTADIINIISIIINIGLALLINYNIQKSLNNKRALKDLLIIEIKEIRTSYNDFYISLLKGNQNANDIKQWLKSMTIKINSIYPLLKKYNIDNNCFAPYTEELRDIITESNDFEKGYKCKSITFSNAFKTSIFSFQKKNDHIFIDIIQKINDN